MAAFLTSILLSFSLLAEFYAPQTAGDGIRYPLVLSPAIWSVLGPVNPVRGTDDLVHLAYVVQLTNHSTRPMTIVSIEVVDPDHGNSRTGRNQVVTILNEDVTAQAQPFNFPSTLDKRNYVRVLAGGETGAVYFDVTYPDRRSVPAHISHRVSVTETAEKGATQSYTAIDEPVTVNAAEPVRLSPPLKGARWLDGNGCCKQITPHRGVLSPINGRVEPAEMFAIDFVQLDAKGRGYTGNVKDLKSYPFYGCSVYAAAAGKVVEVVRALPNEVPGANPPGATAATAAGNHVIVDIGGGRYIMYAHLMPGSVMVHLGQVIQRGFVLGKLGNSGNTDAPHLHFQLMDKPSSLGAHGLPFVFDHMTREATYSGSVESEQDDFIAGKPLLLKSSGSRAFDNTMPLTFDLLDFRF